MGTPPQKKQLAVLIVEDVERDAKLLLRTLAEGGFDVTWERVDTREAMEAALAARAWDVVISDYMMPRFGALQALAVIKDKNLDVPFIVVSGTVTEETAVEAMRAGAHDFMAKGKFARLIPALDRALADAGVRAERSRLELQLRQAQKMEAIGRLAGGIAHDFNNMLSIVLSYSDILLDTMPEGSPHREDIREIANAGQRAAALTRQLLAFSRKQVLEPRTLNLNEVIAGTEKMLLRTLGEDVELVTRPGQDIGMIRADPHQVEQVLLNLVINARDAMPKGGRLTIETQDVELDAAYVQLHSGAKPGRYVMLSVRDTGVGMGKATQSRLFEPFFTTKEAGKGTGLGLATVLGVVQQSGGSVAVESELGTGTEFRIYLPRAAQTEPDAIPVRPPVAAVAKGSGTILVLEDEEAVRRVVCAVLKNEGYQVLEADSPQHAAELCARPDLRIDLLITDVVMPGRSGPDVARELARGRPTMKILCMSGYADEAVMSHGFVETGMAFLQKPITPAGLATKVREVLDPPH
jgi:two-component system cell cycle sensor histidine kinase/response regulator CckA